MIALPPRPGDDAIDQPEPAASTRRRLPGQYAVLSANVEGAAVLVLFVAAGYDDAVRRRQQLGLAAHPLYVLVEPGQ